METDLIQYLKLIADETNVHEVTIDLKFGELHFYTNLNDQNEDSWWFVEN